MSVQDNRNAKWIEECEGNFAENFFDIAEDICKNKHLRIVRLFGPTCSGKTTAAQNLIALFSKLGKRAHVISIDDFFYEKDILHKMSKEKGLDGVDYDSPDTIDCVALEDFVEEIFSATEVHCPIFNFKSGKRDGYKTMSIDDDDIFIFEGIQANYPNVVPMISKHGSASIYIAPLSDISVEDDIFVPNEIRFLRRLVRDYYSRNSSPEFTFMLWESVRGNEEKNIFPYIDGTDYRVNSTMQYELGVLKPFVYDIIAKMDKSDKYYPKAQEIVKRLEPVEPISATLIREGMLYCEFV